MRIIRGRFQGFRFPSYKGSNTRPSTDLVKESLFNTLDSIVDMDGLKVIDLFAGTGNIGLEFLSRGAESLISVDHYDKNIEYMKSIKKSLEIKDWKIVRSDVKKFLKSAELDADLIFADPPYDLPDIHDIVNSILDSEWFKVSNGIFVIEHVDRLVFTHNSVFLKKQFGNTSYTGFRHPSTS